MASTDPDKHEDQSASMLGLGVKSKPKPKLPDGIRIYAVSDIHGRADLLQDVFAAIDHHLARAGPVRALHVFLGDYIDRGPASRQAIDLLIERSRHHESIFLKGNHEAFLFEVLKDASRLETWKEYGGFQTLMSYGLAPSIKPDREEQTELVQALADGMPKHHRRFFNGLRSSFFCGDFFFAHAGVRPGVPLRQQSEEDLLWIRDEFLQSKENFGKFIVHGHTPVPKPDIRPNRINIDTGAYATGILTLLTIQGDRMLQSSSQREPLPLWHINEEHPDVFRIATFLMALALGWFACATIFAETFTPKIQHFSRELAVLDPISYGSLADWATAAPLRGDLLADVAMVHADPVLDLGKVAATPEMIAIRERALNSAKQSLTSAPHSSSMWLLITIFQNQGQARNSVAEVLQMSYLTSPADECGCII